MHNAAENFRHTMYIDSYGAVELIDYSKVMKWVRNKIEHSINEYTVIYTLSLTFTKDQFHLEQVCKDHRKYRQAKVQLMTYSMVRS